MNKKEFIKEMENDTTKLNQINEQLNLLNNIKNNYQSKADHLRKKSTINYILMAVLILIGLIANTFLLPLAIISLASAVLLLIPSTIISNKLSDLQHEYKALLEDEKTLKIEKANVEFHCNGLKDILSKHQDIETNHEVSNKESTTITNDLSLD